MPWLQHISWLENSLYLLEPVIKKNLNKIKIKKHIDIYLNPEHFNFNNFMPAYLIKLFHSIYACIQFSHF